MQSNPSLVKSLGVQTADISGWADTKLSSWDCF